MAAAVANEIDEVKTKIGKVEAEIEEVKVKIGQSETNIEQLTEEITKMKKDLKSSALADKDELLELLAVKEIALKRADSRLASLYSRLPNLDSRLPNLDTQLAEHLKRLERTSSAAPEGDFHFFKEKDFFWGGRGFLSLYFLVRNRFVMCERSIFFGYFISPYWVPNCKEFVCEIEGKTRVKFIISGHNA